MLKRSAARLLVLDPEDRILLFKFVFDEGPLAGKQFWATPGGALHDGESFPEAAARELLEETGILAPIGDEVFQKRVTFLTPTGQFAEADERYFLVRVSDDAVDESGQEPSEARYMKAYRWWALEDLANTPDTVFPEGLAALIESSIVT